MCSPVRTKTYTHTHTHKLKSSERRRGVSWAETTTLAARRREEKRRICTRKTVEYARDYTNIRERTKRKLYRYKDTTISCQFSILPDKTGSILLHISDPSSSTRIDTPLPISLYRRINFVRDTVRNVLISTRPGKPWLPGSPGQGTWAHPACRSVTESSV